MAGGGEGEPELLAGCYRRCFEIAVEQRFESLAFPAISCGVYRYPIDQAVAIAVRETRELLARRDELHVTFATFDAAITAAYEDALNRG